MTSKPKDDKAWELIRSEQGPNLILFQTRYDWVKHPVTTRTMKAVILETADWVNVVALTPQKKILTVNQYRFGIEKTTVEIPAGLMEPDETSEQAAKRELLEETGYTAQTWEYLGEVEANPAFLNNHCHLWLALDVTKTHPTQMDETEEITLGELSLDEIRNEISAGKMRNSLTLLALSRVFDLRDGANRDRF